MTVADDALVALRGLQIGMLAEKVRDLGLDCLGQQGTRPITQDFGELVVDVSGRISLMMLSLDTAYRSFGGEVEASSTPTICRLSDSRRHQLSWLPELRLYLSLEERLKEQRSESEQKANQQLRISRHRPPTIVVKSPATLSPPI